MPCDFVLNRKFAVLGQHQDTRGCELLSNGADFKNSFRRGPGFEFEICEAVRGALDNLIGMLDEERHARNVMLAHFLLKTIIDPIGSNRTDESKKGHNDSGPKPPHG